MSNHNILRQLAQDHYDELGAVFTEWDYNLDYGQSITPEMIVDAIAEKGFDFAADIANRVNQFGGSVTMDDLVNAELPGPSIIEDNVSMTQTGIFITWDAIGWILAVVLLIALLVRK